MNDKEKEILEQCTRMCKNTLMETLDISFCEIGDDYMVAKMPVTPKVHQPDGVLHGGAMVALAETVGSYAAQVFLNSDDYYIRGIEISANHLKSMKKGMVYARAESIHKGRTTQLWDIKLRDENDVIISVVKLTTIALPKNK